jgi:3-oxoadipate enol-lactonase
MIEKRKVRDVELAFDWVDAGPELIVLLHGVGADKSAWAPQVAFFSQLGYSVAAIDMRGSGDSQSRTELGITVPIQIGEFAMDVDQLIKDLGFARAHWVGNSMGGVVIQSGFKRELSTIASAVLCNTFAKHPDSLLILPRAAAALKTKSLQQLAEERIPLAYRPDIDRATLEAGIAAMARKDVETYLLSWRETWVHDYRSLLPTVATPCLVITGAMDKITPPALGLELADLIPNARYHMIKGASHISNQDEPDEFNKVVYEFLKSV